MPIINGVRLEKKEKIKAEINSVVFDEIAKYCTWASIDDIGFFIEEAAGFVFAKDREWKHHKKATKKRVETA